MNEQEQFEVTQSSIMNALDWAYDQAIDGIPGFDSAEELALDYLKGEGSLLDKTNSLIRWQNTKAGTSGFVNGVGGIALMPLTLPASIISVMYVQVRMIAAIAHMGGHDLRDDRVRTLVYACLCGNTAKDLVKDMGIKIGTKLTHKAIKSISGEVIKKINQAVGFRLLTKFGEKGVINLGKAIPIVGGIVGATFDSISTNAIGNVARDTFISNESEDKKQDLVC